MMAPHYLLSEFALPPDYDQRDAKLAAVRHLLSSAPAIGIFSFSFFFFFFLFPPSHLFVRLSEIYAIYTSIFV